MLRSVILCRHGEVDNPKKVFYGRSLDISLSEIGRKQIASIGKQLRSLQIEVKVIHSSTLLRAIQTAEILAQNLSVPILNNSELVDVHIPALVGKPLTIRKELHARGEDEYSGEWLKLGNESSTEVAKRMLSVFQRISSDTKEGIPLIVSHGDPLAFLHYLLENSNESIISISKILKRGYGLKKGSAVLLEFDERGKVKSKKLISPI